MSKEEVSDFKHCLSNYRFYLESYEENKLLYQEVVYHMRNVKGVNTQKEGGRSTSVNDRSIVIALLHKKDKYEIEMVRNLFILQYIDDVLMHMDTEGLRIIYRHYVMRMRYEDMETEFNTSARNIKYLLDKCITYALSTRKSML